MIDWLRQRWFDLMMRRHTIKHKLIFWFVWKLPKEVVEIATVRTWANATSGKFSCDAPQDITVDQALKRWRSEDGGDKTIKRDEVYY